MKSTCMTITVVVEKWQIKPEAKWVPHKIEEAQARVTRKRIFVRLRTGGAEIVFSRETGEQVKRRDPLAFYRRYISKDMLALVNQP